MASMSQPKMQLLPILLLVLLAAMAGATPPGIANHPSHARCMIKKYKYCYNLEHVCPKFCPGGQCTVDCVSCKPICADGTSGPPSVPDSPPGGDDNTPTPSPSTPPTYTPPPSPPTEPQNPPPPPPSPPTNYQTPPPSPPSSPTQTENPPPSPTTPTQSQSPPPYTSPKTVKCKNKNYPQCYNMKHVCPSSCPGGCEVDCVTCKPVCKCDRPGAVCQDPRFIGGDAPPSTFMAKKTKTFALFLTPTYTLTATSLASETKT
ncbi:hypothetical protein DITRI_Ditri01bG0066900 [Diplodiscus trichospermus]